MLFFVSILVYGLSVLPIISLMRIKQFSRYLCAYFVAFIAEIILTGNFLGLVKELNNEILWIGVQLVFLFLSWGVWLYFKRPPLFPFRFNKNIWDGVTVLQKTILITLGISVVIGYAGLVYLILVVPPNNNDSMVVHLVRVGYWLQHGSFTPWNSLNERQVFYPYNAQIIVLWTTLFHGSDLFAPFLQFFSVLFTALGVYSISRELGGSRFQAAVPALFYLTLPQVILQATTAQDDMVIACFLTLGSLFFLGWHSGQYKEKRDLIIASSCFMIAIGIKPTAFYFFIGFAVFLLMSILFKKMKIKRLLHFVIACAVSFLLLSSFAYFNNLISYKNPLGPSDFVSAESGFSNIDSLKKIEVNAGRFLYQFFSLDGLPAPLTTDFQNIKIGIATRYPKIFNTTNAFIKEPSQPFTLSTLPGINEDYSWFGPVSWLLLFPAFILGVFRTIKTKDLRIAFLLVIPVFFILGICVLRPGWDPYQGRYFNPCVAIMMPLAAFLFDRKLIQEVIVLLVSILAILVLTCSVVLNDAKPILTQATIKRTFSNPEFSCNKNHILRYACHFSNIIHPYLPQKADIFALSSLQRQTYTNQAQFNILEYLPKYIPPGSRIALSLLNGDWEYPFFGRKFEYQLVPVINAQLLNDELWLEDNLIDYFIVHTYTDQHSSVSSRFVLHEELYESDNSAVWRIYRRDETED